MCTQYLSRLLVPLTIFCLMAPAVPAEEPSAPLANPSIVYKVRNASTRMEMTVNTSRILTMDQKIPQAQVNNPEILELTPLSPTQIQVSAKETGVTQINLWGEDKKVFTIDVIVLGDVRELQLILQTTFPSAALKVTPVNSSVMISGFVDKPEHVGRIIRIAEEYYPKVINNMTVGGCQQVLLRVKVMEVSRTKLRELGFDWAKITGNNVITSGPIGLITDYDPTDVMMIGGLGGVPGKAAIRTKTSSTFAFNVVDGASGFFGVLDALRQDALAKIMAEPTLVTISGQPAFFNAGGSFYIVPQGLAAGQPMEIKYGTKLKFVPIVLGNGRIRLDVQPEVSQIDPSLTVDGIPGLLLREAHTSVELQAGQTLAIAGLVQSRVEAENKGLPWISELPYFGAAFRSVKEKINEVELIILVTPELVEAMDAEEVPQCGPGMRTTSPSDWELFMKGHLEVPNCGPMGGSCNGGCPPGGLPPEGMILDPSEQIPTPAPADASGRPLRDGLLKKGATAGLPSNAGRNTRGNTAGQASSGTRAVARRGGNPDGSYNRYAPPKPNSLPEATPAESRNGPPGFIGPVGYDVVK